MTITNNTSHGYSLRGLQLKSLLHPLPATESLNDSKSTSHWFTKKWNHTMWISPVVQNHHVGGWCMHFGSSNNWYHSIQCKLIHVHLFQILQTIACGYCTFTCQSKSTRWACDMAQLSRTIFSCNSSLRTDRQSAMFSAKAGYTPYSVSLCWTCKQKWHWQFANAFPVDSGSATG